MTGNLPKFNKSSPLRVLDISSTTFSRKLPDTFGNLRYLNYLSFHDCYFHGSLPPSLGNLTEITHMDLSDNGFTRQVPTSLSKLVQLTWLYLAFNYFSGNFLDVLRNLSKLETISLFDNIFTGQLPTSIFTLNGLLSLDFSLNQYQGQFPSQINGLSYLHGIYLSDNLLRGRVPAWLFTLPSLENLDLSQNKLTSPIEQFQQPGPLREVDLGDNEFHGPIPDSIFQLLDLTYLALAKNNFSGKVILPQLVRVILSSSSITEVPFLTSNSSLQVLDLSSNLLRGQLMDLPTQVYFFSVSNNDLTGEIPPSYCNLSALQSLDLSHNEFCGNIPQCLVNSSITLDFLNLTMNNFHGSIGSLTFPNQCHVTALMLNDNQLEGPLRSSLVNCQDLSILDVGNNRINDSFPNCSFLHGNKKSNVKPSLSSKCKKSKRQFLDNVRKNPQCESHRFPTDMEPFKPGTQLIHLSSHNSIGATLGGKTALLYEDSDRNLEITQSA
ncbi:receptor-like protein 7 [Mangifera indica]|uniref:receptor-like protein 7 n=1 Tax=Mangifera indica TaxID=29780 RepID=UPI001CFBF7E2|nr:receptor-like protein 7 [Mangifera indica]